MNLRAIELVTSGRRKDGWLIFQPDERWRYITHPERSKTGVVCPICQNFSKQQGSIYGGEQVPELFPDYTRSPANPFLVEPNVHVTYPDMLGPCVCELIWVEPIKCLEIRLHAEKEDSMR